MLRFATSPTCDMTIGTLRVAIINYLIAQQRKENFIIRIEDTDSDRNIEGKDTEVMQILEKFALKHDSVSHQSEHLHIHQTLAIRLLEEGKAFVCTCTPEQLTIDRENSKANNVPYSYSGHCINFDYNVDTLKEKKTPFVIRIHQPDRAIINHDLIKGNTKTSPNDIDAFVILHTDGTPTYNFASACDDMLFGVTTFIDEESHLIHAVKQKYITMQLGYDSQTSYAHLPVIVNEKGTKLSENDDAGLVKWMVKAGFVPDAIINYMLLLGYEEVSEEIFTLPEAIEWFDIEKISKLPAKFDLNKLKYINRKHLELMDDKALSSLFGFADTDIGKLAKLYLEEASTTQELDIRIKAIFNAKNFEGDYSEEMRAMETIIQNAPMFSDFKDFESHVMKESSLQGTNFSKPLRLLMTGAEHGPELSDVYPFIKSYLLEIAS